MFEEITSRRHVDEGRLRVTDEDPGESYSQDVRAWCEDFQRVHAPALVSRIAGKLGDRGAAEDIVQNTLLKFLVRLERAPDVKDWRGWVCAAAENAAKNFWVRRKHEGLVPYGLVPDDERGFEPDLGRNLLAKETLHRLPNEQSTAFHLALAGFSSAEAGAMLGTAPSTIRSRTRAARQELQRAVDDAEEDV